MKIKIKEDETEIILWDDDLNNHNFVDFMIKDSDGNVVDDMISIEELYAAVKTFYDKMKRELEHDKLMA